MTASETGREIPADPMAKIRREVDRVNEQSADHYDEWMAERGVTTSRAEWKRRALAAEARIASLEAERARTVEDTARLDWVEANPGAELAKIGGWDCSDDYRWAVHEVRGGRNDREWHEIGDGQTVRAAIDAARHRSLASEKGGQADG